MQAPVVDTPTITSSTVGESPVPVEATHSLVPQKESGTASKIKVSNPTTVDLPPGYVELVQKAQHYEKLLTQVVKLTTEVERLTEVNKQLSNKNTDLSSKLRSLQLQTSSAKPDETKPVFSRTEALKEKDDSSNLSNIQTWHVIVIAIICLILGKIL